MTRNIRPICSSSSVATPLCFRCRAVLDPDRGEVALCRVCQDGDRWERQERYSK